MWLLGLKGKNVYICIAIRDWTTEDINLIIFYNASYLINNKVGRQETRISVQNIADNLQKKQEKT